MEIAIKLVVLGVFAVAVYKIIYAVIPFDECRKKMNGTWRDDA